MAAMMHFARPLNALFISMQLILASQLLCTITHSFQVLPFTRTLPHQKQLHTSIPIHISPTHTNKISSRRNARWELHCTRDPSSIEHSLAINVKKVENVLFTYADLRPYNERTIEGAAFLLTNVPYLLIGLLQVLSGTSVLGAGVEAAGLMSCWYHWCQLHYGPNAEQVKLALLIDYITALSAILFGFNSMMQLIQLYGISSISIDFYLTGSIAIVCLFGSWSEGLNSGYKYMILHGMWHILSAQSAAVLGQCIYAVSN